MTRPTLEITSRVAGDKEDFNESTQNEEPCDGNETRVEGYWSKVNRPVKEGEAEIGGRKTSSTNPIAIAEAEQLVLPDAGRNLGPWQKDHDDQE